MPFTNCPMPYYHIGLPNLIVVQSIVRLWLIRIADVPGGEVPGSAIGPRKVKGFYISFCSQKCDARFRCQGGKKYIGGLIWYRGQVTNVGHHITTVGCLSLTRPPGIIPTLPLRIVFVEVIIEFCPTICNKKQTYIF